ncbi:MAG TPA: DUF327 domain-containing protein, partial [Lachnospiraceae bacterium]|nr:DUF327 domain-containing protein [Lachnospiraceae bacterium]
MDIKVNNMQALNQVETKKPVQEADGSFKFALISNIEEHDLQARLSAMLEEITSQGKKLAKR